MEALVQEPKSHLIRAMRPGKSLTEIATEMDRVADAKRDFTVPVKALRASTIDDENGKPTDVSLSFAGNEVYDFGLTIWSGQQLSAFTDIPSQYFRRLRSENPELLAKNINHGFRREESNRKNRLIRTLDGNVRGFLSNRYLVLDSQEILMTALPMLQQHKFEVIQSEMTEKRFYLKAATPRIQGEVKKDDVVSYGVMISTSDVGAGSIMVEPYFLRLWCLNGAVSMQTFNKYHAGRSLAEREVQEILSDETRTHANQAILGTIRDMLAHTMKPEVFQTELQKMKDATTRKITNGDLDHVVEVTMKEVGVTGKSVKEAILEALVDDSQGCGLNQWGLSNSFTAAAKLQTIDYDSSIELERAGGAIINLTPSQWRRISEKAS